VSSPLGGTEQGSRPTAVGGGGWMCQGGEVRDGGRRWWLDIGMWCVGVACFQQGAAVPTAAAATPAHPPNTEQGVSHLLVRYFLKSPDRQIKVRPAKFVVWLAEGQWGWAAAGSIITPNGPPSLLKPLPEPPCHHTHSHVAAAPALV